MDKKILTSGKAEIIYSSDENSRKYISVSVSYVKDDYNGFKNRRGYWLNVHPEEARREYCDIIKSFYWQIEFMAFSGYRFFLGEIKRDSKKAFSDALKVASENLPGLVFDVCRKNNIVLPANWELVNK
jgi:hypothetical protein